MDKYSAGLGIFVAGLLAAVSVGVFAVAHQRDARCMTTTLRANPLIDQVETNAFSIDGWKNPYVSYRYNGKDGQGTVRLERNAEYSRNGTSLWVTGISGLFGEGAGPSDLGTSEMSNQWEQQCHVRILVVFE